MGPVGRGPCLAHRMCSSRVQTCLVHGDEMAFGCGSTPVRTGYRPSCDLVVRLSSLTMPLPPTHSTPTPGHLHRGRGGVRVAGGGCRCVHRRHIDQRRYGNCVRQRGGGTATAAGCAAGRGRPDRRGRVPPHGQVRWRRGAGVRDGGTCRAGGHVFKVSYRSMRVNGSPLHATRADGDCGGTLWQHSLTGL